MSAWTSNEAQRLQPPDDPPECPRHPDEECDCAPDDDDDDRAYDEWRDRQAEGF